jgi:hypothetical protein
MKPSSNSKLAELEDEYNSLMSGFKANEIPAPNQRQAQTITGMFPKFSLYSDRPNTITSTSTQAKLK